MHQYPSEVKRKPERELGCEDVGHSDCLGELEHISVPPKTREGCMEETNLPRDIKDKMCVFSLSRDSSFV